jgi:hypothetical protein
MKSDEIDDDDEMIFQIRTCNFQRGKYSTVLAELLTVGKLKILRSFSLGFEAKYLFGFLQLARTKLQNLPKQTLKTMKKRRKEIELIELS